MVIFASLCDFVHNGIMLMINNPFVKVGNFKIAVDAIYQFISQNYNARCDFQCGCSISCLICPIGYCTFSIISVLCILRFSTYCAQETLFTAEIIQVVC